MDVRKIKKFRIGWHHTRRTPDGTQSAIKIGVNIGYWPCAEGPYFQVCLYKRILSFWYGYKGYRK